MRVRLWDLAAALLGCCVGAVLPPAAQRLTVAAVVLLAVLAVLTHLCGGSLRLFVAFLQVPRPGAPTPPRIRPSRRGPTPAQMRRLAWLARSRPPHTGPPCPGRRPDHPDGLLQDPAAPP